MANDVLLLLAQNITQLHKTCSKPIPPTRNPLPTTARDEKRVLTLPQELNISNCLNYLSAHSNHPSHVNALCVEEGADRQSLVVCVAKNTGSLSYLQQGIESIVGLLQRHARDPRHDHLDELLKMVLAHGRARMVRRLELKNTKTCTTAASLEKAMSYALKTRPGFQQSHQSLLDLSSELSRLSNIYGKSSSQGLQGSRDSVLMSILTAATRIWTEHRTDLENIVAQVPEQDMDKHTKEVLICQMGHLGHYIPTAMCLLRYAQTLPVFRTVGVRPVYMEPVNLLLLLPKSASKRTVHKHKDTISRITHNTVNSSYKVHAEIQLLLYYEQNPVPFPPRILKSSKYACFLCDLFIKTHGRFHIPKTHGRVYELWMLPDLQGLGFGGKKRRSFNTTVENFSKEIAELTLKRSGERKIRLDDPRESGIFSFASSAMESSKSSPSASVDEEAVSDFDELVEEAGGDDREEVGEVISDLDELEEEVAEENGETAGGAISDLDEPEEEIFEENREEVGGGEGFVSPLTSSSPGFPPTCPQVVDLAPASPQLFIFSLKESSVRFHTPKMHIEISNSQVRSTAPESSPKRIRVAAEWLDADQAVTMTETYAESVADLGEVWQVMEAKEGILFSDSGLLIRKKDHVVQIVASYVESRRVDSMFVER